MWWSHLRKKTDVLITLNNIIHNNARDGKETIIIVDEAHCIEQDGIFEELRLLLNFQLPDRFLLNLLFFGQPELLQKIETNKPLSQRINIKCHLDSFNSTETKKYIEHRLKIAGRTNTRIFNDEALDLIYTHSDGIPRRINQICDMALFTGHCEGIKMIDAKIIEGVVKDWVV